MKITILDGYGLNPGDLSWEGMERLGEVTVYDRTPEELIVPRSLDSEILITNKTPITEESIRVLPKLRYIGVLATGYNIVDVKAAKEAGIVVTNIPAYSTDSVAQNVFALLLTITNHAEYYTEQNRLGRWSHNPDFCYWDYPLMELAGKRLGVVGYGHTGKAVTRIAQAFGMRTAAYSSKPQEAMPETVKMDLDELFRECDVVSLHCPLTETTRHLVDTRRLELMKPSAILINTGRGPLVDEEALALALNEERIYAAGLDVLSQEPPHEENPLLKARNCHITPHISWATREARIRLMDIAVNNLRSFLEGKSVNNVAY